MKFLFCIFCFFFAFNARAAVVSEQAVLDAVKAEALEQGFNLEWDLEVFAGQTTFDLGNAQNYKILISNLKADEEQNRFDCQVTVFADGTEFDNSKIAGRFFVLKEVYVPARNIAKDEIIKPDMLKNVKMRANRLKAFHLTEKEQLIGHQAGRALKEGKPIMDKDVGAVIVIKKGDIINAVYLKTGMEIEMKVQALKDAAIGDNLEVLNTRSKKTLLGKVRDENTVVIEAGE